MLRNPEIAHFVLLNPRNPYKGGCAVAQAAKCETCAASARLLRNLAE
jgi:hypothetical protein